jgi:hypothetical protein
MNTQVTAYINQASIEQKEIMEIIRQIIHESVPGVNEEFKWSRPVFRSTKDFAYLKTAKNYITLGFFNFEKLDDNQNMLEGTGKDMRHIKLKNAENIDRILLKKWFAAASAT